MQVSQLISLAKVALKGAICLLLLFLVLRWVNFSFWQSLMLTMLVLMGYGAYEVVALSTAAGGSFSPYRVLVLPKFDQLLLDYKLLKNVEQAEALHALWVKKDQRLISFTVLEYQSSGDPLVYYDTDSYFLSRLDFEEPIEAIVFRAVREQADPVYLRDPTTPEDIMLRHIPLSFYFRHAVGGYDLGLNVREDWWKEIVAGNPDEEFAKTKVHFDYIIGEAKLIIATIPYAAFSLFHAKGGDHKQMEKVWEAMDGQLALHGWKRQRSDPDAEVRDPWIRIEHKYFHVRYREI